MMETFAGNTTTIVLTAVLELSTLYVFVQKLSLPDDCDGSNCGGFITSPKIHDKV